MAGLHYAKALNAEQFELFRAGRTAFATVVTKFGRDTNMSVPLKGLGEAFSALR